jgi:hypothetical protein
MNRSIALRISSGVLQIQVFLLIPVTVSRRTATAFGQGRLPWRIWLKKSGVISAFKAICLWVIRSLVALIVNYLDEIMGVVKGKSRQCTVFVQ